MPCFRTFRHSRPAVPADSPEIVRAASATTRGDALRRDGKQTAFGHGAARARLPVGFDVADGCRAVKAMLLALDAGRLNELLERRSTTSSPTRRSASSWSISLRRTAYRFRLNKRALVSVRTRSGRGECIWSEIWQSFPLKRCANWSGGSAKSRRACPPARRPTFT